MSDYSGRRDPDARDGQNKVTARKTDVTRDGGLVRPEGRVPPVPSNLREPTSPLEGVRLIAFPGNPDGKRQITVVEFGETLPFKTERVYWLHNIEKGEVRGHHAHRSLSQIIFAVNGAFGVDLHDGTKLVHYNLSQPTHGLYIPSRLWRTIEALEPNSTLVVLASHAYDESDYIRDFEEFRKFSLGRRELEPAERR